jgi:hypothetical protein
VPPGFKDITNLMVSFGRILLITNTHPTYLTYSVVMSEVAPPFEKV